MVYIYYDGPGLVGKARELRRTQTEAEIILWEQVRNRRLGGYKIRRQQVLNEIIVDFYCTEKRLCIEIDGPYHNEPIMKGLDQQRDNELEAHGFVVQRYSNDQVIFDLEAVLADMLNLLETLPSEKRRFLNHNPHIDLGHEDNDNIDPSLT